jgi:hypothetical protein
VDPGILKKHKRTQCFGKWLQVLKKTQKNTTFRKVDPCILKNTKEHNVSETGSSYLKKNTKEHNISETESGSSF